MPAGKAAPAPYHAKPKKAKTVKENGERWLLTYADMITLLMLFFIVLYSLSSQSPRKFTLIAKSLNHAFAVDVKNTTLARVTQEEATAGEGLLEKLRNDQGGELADKQLANIIDQIAIDTGAVDQISTSYTSEGVVISVLGSLLFQSGKAELRAESKQTLGSVTKLLAQLPYNVRVEGHTDDIPPTNSIYKNNLGLSVARGTSVAEFLQDNGISSSRLSAAGYADSRPKKANDSPASRAANRRVDIVVLTKEAQRDILPRRP